jgi:hypothetical protein
VGPKLAVLDDVNNPPPEVTPKCSGDPDQEFIEPIRICFGSCRDSMHVCYGGNDLTHFVVPFGDMS